MENNIIYRPPTSSILQELQEVQMQSYAQRRGNLTHYVSTLHIPNAEDKDAGRYQCIISNEYGSAYSSRANINVYGK